MKLRLIATIVTGATAAMLASAAFGQANPQNSGYVLFGYGTPANNVWRSGSYGGKPGVNDTLCWRTGYWTPPWAIVECDPDLVRSPRRAGSVVTPPHPLRLLPGTSPGADGAEDYAGTKALFDFDKSVSSLKARRHRQRSHQQAQDVSKLELVLVTVTPTVSAPRPTTRGCRASRNTVRDYLSAREWHATRSRLWAWARRSRPGVVCNQKA